ncbi:MAG TPA: hypothetical protein VGQ06_06750 [Gemmatimonadales bacterium]|nr:hypothetical protein [Gemmatimonadales bacterium]
MRLAWPAAFVVLGLFAPGPAATQRPRWAGLEGVIIGGPVDDLLAKDGECWPAEMASIQLIVVDVPACTAFDRRVHRAGASGVAGEC